MIKHIFIIGSRGLPAKYGGFETFVEELVKHQKNENIKYHVACQSENSDLASLSDGHFDYLGADCFAIEVPNIGPARVIAYDILAIKKSFKIIKEEDIEKPIFYILGNTIGGFIGRYAKKIHKIEGKLFVNPDGLEWRRTKWAAPVRKYLKFAEKKMVKHADLIISDNKGIKEYLTEEYGHIDSEVIAYGTETDLSSMTHSPTLQRFAVKDYFLIVGRFVPENNYELLIRSFMASNTEKDLVIITNYEGNTFYEELRQKTAFDQDKRIKFVGTVYDQNELRYIREHATAYLHGHEVGGTNPGLLEAMWSTAVNLVLDVNFNRETAGESVLYFSKDELAEKINQISNLEITDRKELQKKSRTRIQERYMWDMICTQYEELFVES
ncbi:beta 1-4 rhamnosyltransferase Cps2T [Lactococcus garvieae]|uniref:Alpha-D-GlcNAc alpha-1,2-L-rhamnosyltransferase n=1 Tax=Lactococcus garvieae DCC43 TaxID=1231377 RepID=K2NYG5_9LACT|nr:glycosyltransferase family 1 protein [Lactococcus garvieae]EKF52593.1 Alpha-D-GlcNAc alpha-1,2-L-rhamnosyltransferase [Lactococcus garvieae DCC43]QPS70931.1 glycosyltransferase family 1 protein [Lactococcus garvieae]